MQALCYGNLRIHPSHSPLRTPCCQSPAFRQNAVQTRISKLLSTSRYTAFQEARSNKSGLWSGSILDVRTLSNSITTQYLSILSDYRMVLLKTTLTGIALLVLG